MACDIIGRAASSRPKSIDIVRSHFGATQIKDNEKISSGDDQVFDELLVSDDKDEYHWWV